MGGGVGAVWEAGDSLVARVVAFGSVPELPKLRSFHRYRVAPPAPPITAPVFQPPLHSAVRISRQILYLWDLKVIPYFVPILPPSAGFLTHNKHWYLVHSRILKLRLICPKILIFRCTYLDLQSSFELLGNLFQVQSMTKRGLRLFYSEDEGDSSDDCNKMALATVRQLNIEYPINKWLGTYS